MKNVLPRKNGCIDIRVKILSATMIVASDGHRLISPKAAGWSVSTILRGSGTSKERVKFTLIKFRNGKVGRRPKKHHSFLRSRTTKS